MSDDKWLPGIDYPESVHDGISRENAQALIADAQRWGRAYDKARDEVAALAAEVEQLREYYEAREAHSKNPLNYATTNRLELARAVLSGESSNRTKRPA